MNKKEKVFSAVMKFMKITYQCYKDTNYAEDRVPFQSDIALSAGWLIKIYDDVAIEDIILEILDAASAKHILDYYKQGKFGDIQASAFVELKKEIRNA